MANQMIALGAKAPQINPLSGAVQQNAQMINMMRQQDAAERQAAAAAQQMQIAAAKEQREAALAKPQMAEAEQKAVSAQVKAVSDFLDFSIEGLKLARSVEDAVKIGDWLKSQFRDPQLQASVDQTLASLLEPGVDFEERRKEMLFQSMDAKDQLEQHIATQNTGRETFQTASPKYAGAPQGMVATEIPGTRVRAAEDITYVRGPNGEIIPMPKTVPGTGGLVGGERGGAAAALQTNPGAIKDSPFARSQPGYAGASGGFATFSTPEAGIRAQENLLRSAYVGKGFNTIDKIVNRYAPQGPENSAASVSNYKKYIADRTGLDINAPISAGQIPAVAAAMREFETGNRPGGNRGGIEMGKPVPGTGKGEKVSAEAYNAMEAATAKYDDTIARAKRLLNNPALDSIVGNIQGNIPEKALSVVSQNAANALSDYNELLAIAGFQELQAMRDASPTGGALGQVSDSENRLLQQSAFASSRTQDEAKFKQSLRNYIKRLEESKRRVEGAYERTFGNRFAPQRAAPAAAPAQRQTPAGGRNIDALLKKYGG